MERVVGLAYREYRRHGEIGCNCCDCSEWKIIKRCFEGGMMLLVGETIIADTHISIILFCITIYAKILREIMNERGKDIPFYFYYNLNTLPSHKVYSGVF